MFKHLGLPPRAFSDDLLHVVGKKKLPLLGKSKLKEKLENAYILKAAIVQAGSGVFDGSTLSSPAIALYTFDKDAYLDEEKLLEINEKVRELKSKDDLNDEEVKLANILLDSHSYPYHVPVPKNLTDGKEYFISRFLLKREYFEDQKIPEPLIADAIVYIDKHPKVKPTVEHINVYKYLKVRG